MKNSRTLVLDTGLYPDAATVADAVETFTESQQVTTLKIDPDSMTPSDWDAAIVEILHADRCITL